MVFFHDVRYQGRVWVLVDNFDKYLLFLDVAPCWGHANRGIGFFWGGGRFRLTFCQGFPCFGGFFQEVSNQGRVWGLADNFYKYLLVLGCVYMSSSCK